MDTDVAIVGAGPAGLAAADVLAGTGMSVTLLDEQGRAGGQILRQPPPAFRVEHWLESSVYAPQKRLLARSGHWPGVNWLYQTTVLGIEPHHEGLHLQLRTAGRVTTLRARRVLLATGCHDMPVAFTGSTLPGVMATGGIQAFIKSQQIVPGQRFVFGGSHPLQLIVADQVLRAGGDVAGVYFSQSPGIFVQALRQLPTMLRYPRKMAYLAGCYAHLLRRGVPVRFGRVVAQAQGENQLSRVTIAASESPAGPVLEQVDCDRLGVGFSFLANSQLALQVGTSASWSDTRGGWLVDTDTRMRTSVDGLYAAGELTGIGGADVSQHEGAIAGLAMALDAGKLSPDAAERAFAGQRRKLQPLQRFARVLADLSYPGKALLRQLATDDSIVCKCEEVTAGSVRTLLASEPPPGSINAVKLISRCGMGHCQGRYCQYNLRALFREGATRSVSGGDRFTTRFPIKPVPLGDIAASD